MTIGTIIKLLLKIFGFFTDPEVRNKNRKTSILAAIKKLEDKIGLAFASGDPIKAAVLDQRLRALRKKIKYIEANE